MAVWLTYFELICNLTVLLLIVFTALSYATGLFYLAELAEEFPTFTRRVIVGLLVALCTLHALGFILSPLSKTALLLGLVTHASYYRLMANFPYLPLTSPTFFLSLALLLASQVWWYLQLNASPPPSSYSSYSRYAQHGSPYQYGGGPQYTTAQQMAFYFLFIWLLPLIFFIAGSVSSQALPQMGDRLREEDEGEKKGRKAKWSLSSLKRWVTRDKAEPRDSPALTGRSGPALSNGGGDDYARAQRAYVDSARGETGASAHTQSHAQLQPSWYPAGSGVEAGPTAAAASSEGEWMGQTALPPRPVYHVRQRSHLS